MLKLIIISVVFGSMVALAALICGTILLIVKMRGKEGVSGGTDREETRIIQEIYQGLDRMEDRIEALEVILAENPQNRGRTKEKEKEERP